MRKGAAYAYGRGTGRGRGGAMKRKMRQMTDRGENDYIMQCDLATTNPDEAARLSLQELQPGDRAVVQNINGGYGILNRLCALGLVPGTSFQVIRNPGRGPILLEVHNTRIAISRGQAQKVSTELLEEPLAAKEE